VEVTIANFQHTVGIPLEKYDVACLGRARPGHSLPERSVVVGEGKSSELILSLHHVVGIGLGVDALTRKPLRRTPRTCVAWATAYRIARRVKPLSERLGVNRQRVRRRQQDHCTHCDEGVPPPSAQAPIQGKPLTHGVVRWLRPWLSEGNRP